MKKLLGLMLALAMIIICFSGCDDLSGTSKDIPSSSSSKVLLIEKDEVKISVEGLSSKKELLGVGEGIKFLVENLRSEGVIISVSEVSVNSVMKTVIQPQMPNNITSAGKSSTQTIIFQDAQLESAEVELKIHVLDEDFKEIFVTDFITINF